MEAKTLNLPAPRRASHKNGELYFSTPYSIHDVVATLSCGGWFRKGYHDFKDSDAETLAMRYSEERTH